ncbi:MAG TPA: hypothetical protein VGF23_21890 [Gaiellaceae bacterium]
MATTPSTINPLSGGSLTITDPKRKAYPEAWIGMADDVEGKSKWLRVGGISDGSTSRLAIAAGRTSIQGNLGVNCLPTEQALEVRGGVHASGSLSVDKAISAGTVNVNGSLTVDNAITAGTVGVSGLLSVGEVTDGALLRAGGLALSTTPPGDTASPGAWTSLSSNAYHDDAGAWHHLNASLPAVTLEIDSRMGSGRFQVWMTKKASPLGWEGRLAIDGETGTVAVYGPLTVKGDVYVKGALVDEIGLPYLSAAEIVNHNAALPVTKSFKTKGRTVILLASGSGYSGTKDKTIGMDIQIDKVSRRQAKTFANEASSHNAFVAPYLVLTDLAAGDHTITLSALSGTTTDVNDYFSVVMIEL